MSSVRIGLFYLLIWSFLPQISLGNPADDTLKLLALDKLAQEKLHLNPDSAYKIAQVQEKLAMHLHQPKWLAKAFSTEGKYYYNKEDYHHAIHDFFKSLKIALEIGDKKQIAGAYNNIGLSYCSLSEYSKALEYFLNNLKIKKELEDKKGISNAYNNLGIVYYNLGNYHKALDYYFKSKGISESLGEKKLMADVYNNIGNVYLEQTELDQALDYYLKSLYIKEGLAEKQHLLGCYGNIGAVYFKQGHFAKALEFHRKDLALCQHFNNKQDIAACYNNIAEVYITLFNTKLHLTKSESDSLQKEIPAKGRFLDSALHLLTQALKLNEEVHNTPSSLISINNIGKIYVLKQEWKKANTAFEQSTRLSAEIHDQKEFINAAKGLYTCAKALGNTTEALKWHENYVSARDSFNNIENSKATYRQQLNYEFEKKNAILKLEDEKNALQYEASMKHQRIILIAVVLILLLVALFSVFMYRRVLVIQKQKKIIETKNKEILDSIHYAKRIQDALLKDTTLNPLPHIPDHFILFRPKDIVSGDFFWSVEKNGYWYITAADCTGHGVPGGFMSMLGIAFLNEINAASQVLSAAEILDHLGKKIIAELGQTGREGESKDGMDISLIRIDLASGELNWAGANSSMYLIQDDQIEEIKPDKQPIGYHVVLKPFTNHYRKLTKGGRIYLFTDGYADQFGGPQGKKFKYKQLENLLQTTSLLPLKEQKAILDKAFLDWKGNAEQVDDICLIGLEF